jgi:beta-glucosidase-like glycosyl hydrolase
MVSREAKAIGAGMMLSAQLDIQRIPQFTRTKDQMGADPYLLSRLADDMTKGMQSEGGIAVLKHYVAYTEGSNNDVVSEQALHEVYLPSFESAVKDGNALGIMSSYNMINGTYASANDYTQETVLRGQWGYQYFLITDWGGNHEFTMDNGTDIEMATLNLNSQESAQALVEQGVFTQEEIDEMVDTSVTRILKAYGMAGYLTLVDFDEDGNLLEEVGRTEPIAQIDRETTVEKLAELQESSNDDVQTVAEAGGVLLKNENETLPLQEGESVAVVGITGKYLASGFGGERSYGAISAMVSPYAALQDNLGEENVTCAVYNDIIGTTIPNENLYTTADGDEHGVVRTYGCLGTMGNSEGQQGQAFRRGNIAETAMEGHEIGELCAIDETIDYTTGTVNGEPNKTYLNANADEGTATAFDVSTNPAYTIESYIEAPEDGEYTIVYQSNGDTSKIYLYDTDGETELATATGVYARQNSSWYSSIVPTETGMNAEDITVTLKAGERYKVSIQIVAGVDNKDVQCNLSWITPSQKQANVDEAIEAAKNNDKVVIFAYRQNSSNSGSSRDDLTLRLDEEQEEMIKSVAAAAHEAGNEVVVVLNNDGPVVMSEWIDEADAILEMYYPGQRGGIATANLLTGAVNPSGKLAYTVPKSDYDTLITCSDAAFATFQQVVDENTNVKSTVYYEGINTDYKWFDENDIEPEFDFGYGLSYTTFEYSDLSVELAPAEDESVGYDVTFTVTNTGDVTGSEVTELYLGEAEVPDGIQSSKYTLAGFEKVKDLEPGESREVTLHVTERSLSYWNSNLTDEELNEDGTKWTVATGERTIYVGASSDNLILQADVDVE